jgi:hypothetical protein
MKYNITYTPETDTLHMESYLVIAPSGALAIMTPLYPNFVTNSEENSIKLFDTNIPPLMLLFEVDGKIDAYSAEVIEDLEVLEPWVY